MMLAKLQSGYPDVDSARLGVLAEIWDVELDRIVKRMLDISTESVAALPLAAKHEVVFEMAKLVNFIADKIVEKKLSDSRLEEIDLDEERDWLESPACAERIENTARIFAENVWVKFLNEWWEKHPVVLSSSSPIPKRRKFAKRGAGGVRRQHFSPKFSNKYWADEKRKVRIYRPALDGSVTAEDRPMAEWSREDYLYSQALESLFSAIESDAGVPYQKLLDMVPFSEDDRRHWVAFLIAQLFRTPSSILRSLEGLKKIIERDGIDYGTDAASLRRAHETLFTNDQVFGTFYRQICGHEWSLLSVDADHGAFVRGDVPVVIHGSDESRTWKLLYPMSPTKCFVSGPTMCEIPDVPIPRVQKLDATQLHTVNQLLAARCRRTAMGVTWQDQTDVVANAMATQTESLQLHEPAADEYWGRPC